MADRLPSRALHQYVPLDTPKAVKGFLDHWSPDLAVFAESELWPNLISATHERGTPMALVNARMNEKSIRSWRRRREAARYLLGCFNWIGPADERTRSGISELLGNKPLDLVGNIKLEAKPMPPDPHELSRVRVALGGRPVWLAASTHSGEEGVARRRLGMCVGQNNVDELSGEPALGYHAAFEQCQCVVSTPELLLRALEHAELRMEQVALLVLDECHNATGDSPGAIVLYSARPDIEPAYARRPVLHLFL